MEDFEDKRAQEFADLRVWLRENAEDEPGPESELEQETRIAVAAVALKERVLDTLRAYVLTHPETPYEAVRRALASADEDYQAEFLPNDESIPPKA